MGGNLIGPDPRTITLTKPDSGDHHERPRSSRSPASRSGQAEPRRVFANVDGRQRCSGLIRNRRLGRRVAHGHPEPVDMRADNGTFDRADRNSYSPYPCPGVPQTDCAIQIGGTPARRPACSACQQAQCPAAGGPCKGFGAAVRLISMNLAGPAVGLTGSSGHGRDRRGRALGGGVGGCGGVGGRRATAGRASCNRGHGVAGLAWRSPGGMIASGRSACSTVAFAGLPGGGPGRLVGGGSGG